MKSITFFLRNKFIIAYNVFSCLHQFIVTMSDGMKSLAEALDEDIDNFMESLPKRPYKDGWPEDKWQEVNNEIKFLNFV